MSTIGKDIELPIVGAFRVKGTDNEMLDLLFDLQTPAIAKAISTMNKVNRTMLMIVRCHSLNLVAMVQFIPPDIWLDFEGQKYQIVLSQDLRWMEHYWQDRRIHQEDNLA